MSYARTPAGQPAKAERHRSKSPAREGKGPSGDEAQRHSGRKTGFLTGATIPLDGGSISDPVLLPIRLRIRVLPELGKRDQRTNLYYTSQV